MYLEIKGKRIGPYSAIKYSNGDVKGDILEILYDNAIIELSDNKNSFVLCYKKTKSLFGKDLIYADLVNEKTAETFSFQVSNIYLLKIIDADIKMIAKVGNELKFFSNFGRQTVNIESDGDKTELTPLGYFETFVTYDDSYYYPLFLDGFSHNKRVKKFYDYYGYRTFVDENGLKHFYMLIEYYTSSETNPIWYFVDNFEIISEKLYFDDYVENWSVDEDGDITMETTSLKKYYIEVGKSKKIVVGTKPKKEKNKSSVFLFTRAFEDTDSDYVVGKRTEGYFILSKKINNISIEDQKIIEYFDDFISFNREYSLFIMKNKSGEIVILDIYGTLVLTTDLHSSDKIEDLKISSDKKILSIKLKGEATSREYIL